MTKNRHQRLLSTIIWFLSGFCTLVFIGGCQVEQIAGEAMRAAIVDEPVSTLSSSSVSIPISEEVVESQSAESPNTPDPTVAAATPTPTVNQEIPEVTASPNPGQVAAELVANEPIRYVVVAGDTTYEIALQYGVSVEDIVAANQLSSADLIQLGQELIIPLDSSGGPVTALPTAILQVEPLKQVSPQLQPGNYACSENSTVYKLQLSSDPIQILAEQDLLYFIADGSLYELWLGDLASSQPLVPANLMPSKNIVGNYSIREFVYLTHDSTNGDLLVLDKTNDIYRYSRSGIWTMEIPAQPVPGQFPDPQYLAIQERQGSILALDADLSHIWELSRQRPMPTPYFVGKEIESAVDMALVQDGDHETLYVLTREGTVTKIDRYRDNRNNTSVLPIERVSWPSQVQMNGGQLLTVDGNARSIRFYDPINFASMAYVTFRHPNMQRLRQAAVFDQTIFAIAGSTLYVVSFSQLNDTCSPVAYDDNFYFDSQNIHDLLPRVDLPFANAVLPIRPRSYPGARRLYRYGLHEGLDLYALDAPGLRMGSPVRSIADGIVIRVDTGFVEMMPNEYEEAMQQTKDLHRTGAVLTDKLLGRQVHIAHSDQVVTRYGHLNEVSSAISLDNFAQMGTTVGTVGLSGTSGGVYGSAGGEHLHLEIWVNGRYLGQGLNLYETIRLWQEVFR